MKTNNEKMKWYILIAAALLVGAIVGYFATANLATTGNAKAIISQKEGFNNNTIPMPMLITEVECNRIPGAYVYIMPGYYPIWKMCVTEDFHYIGDITK